MVEAVFSACGLQRFSQHFEALLRAQATAKGYDPLVPLTDELVEQSSAVLHSDIDTARQVVSLFRFAVLILPFRSKKKTYSDFAVRSLTVYPVDLRAASDAALAGVIEAAMDVTRVIEASGAVHEFQQAFPRIKLTYRPYVTFVSHELASLARQ